MNQCVGAPPLLPVTFHTPLSSVWVSPPLCSPSNMLTAWLITSLILPMARVWRGGWVIQTGRSIPVNVSSTAVSLSHGFSGSGSEKLLNDRSSEAAGRRWHLSSVTVLPPFPCQRPDKPVCHIYNPLSVPTSVWLLTLRQTLRIPHLNQTSAPSPQGFCQYLPK